MLLARAREVRAATYDPHELVRGSPKMQPGMTANCEIARDGKSARPSDRRMCRREPISEAVSVERLPHFLGHRGAERGRSTQIATSLGRDSKRQVARPGLAMLHFAVRRQAKSLLGAFVRFLFGHGCFTRHPLEKPNPQ